MTTIEPNGDEHHARSVFAQQVVHRIEAIDTVPRYFASALRRTIVMFWDDPEQLPTDVSDCIASWQPLLTQGFELCMFDSTKARAFIANRLGSRYESAFRRCYHPAMQSDYFRLCYIYVEGGCYIDVDDVYTGCRIQHLFDDSRLKVQPLCYDKESGQMIPPNAFTKPGAEVASWIFYFNNNPLVAASGHPIIERALANATVTIEQSPVGELPEIQSTTGPGNLTRTIFEMAQRNPAILSTLRVLRDWEEVAKSRWPLGYRSDRRNWRLSNCQAYTPLRERSQ